MSTPENAEKRAKPRLEPMLRRGLGVPGLFVAVYTSVGFSIYFALGVVADRGLGLTPLIFLAAGLLVLASKRRRGIHIHSMLSVSTHLPFDAELPAREEEARAP